MAAPVLSSHRARLITAALLAAPPANPWTRPTLFPICARTYLVAPCRAGEFNRPGKSANSSFGKQQPFGGSSSSRSSAAKGREQQGSDQQRSSQPSRSGHDSSPNSSRSNSRRDSSSSTGSNVNQQTSRPGVAVGKGPQQHSPTAQNPTRPRSTYNSDRSSSGAMPPPTSSPLPQHAPLLVVGAGAAGLTAAYFAAKQGAQVGDTIWLLECNLVQCQARSEVFWSCQERTTTKLASC